MKSVTKCDSHGRVQSVHHHLTLSIKLLQRKKPLSDIPLEPSKRHSMTEDEKVALWMPKGAKTTVASRAASLNSNSNNASDG